MTRLQRIAFSTTAMAFTTFLGASLSAQQPQPTADPSVPQLRLEQRDTKTAGTTLEGELVQVDTTAKMLTIKTEDGKTERIRYNDATKVTGAQSGIAGLANQNGTDVTITFIGTGTARVATEIVVEKGKP